MKFDYEVLIIGGGPAGLSAAMTLGRILRSALVVDDDRPRNAPSSHINNFPGLDGIHPEEWRKRVRKDLEKYKTIGFSNGTVLSVEKLASGFQARLSSGPSIAVKKVVLAYGITDKMPPLPGFKELWGKSIFHCPFCHGFEIRGSKTGVWISNEMGLHILPMIRGLTSDLILFTDGKVALTDDQRALLLRQKIAVVEDKISSLHHDGEVLTGIEVAHGKIIERHSLFYSAELPLQVKSDIGSYLGCKKSQFGLYEVTEMGMTSVDGVFAAGDNMTVAQSVLLGCASGTKAALGTIAQLLTDELRDYAEEAHL